MNEILLLIATALTLGAFSLAGFLWAVNTGQFDDLDGAAHRILFDDDPVTGGGTVAANGGPPVSSTPGVPPRDLPPESSGGRIASA